MRFVHGLLISRSLRVAALALGLALMVVSPGTAASGQFGVHGLTEATCMSGKRVLVQLPYVAAASRPDPAGTFTVGGVFGGGTNLQWIGVRVWLIKANPVTGQWQYTDQNRDGSYDRTAEFQLQTTSQGALVGSNWWNADARRSIAAGDNTFYAREPGHYALMTQYFWYTNGQVTGYDLLASSSHYVTEYFTVAKPYCTF